MRYYLRSHLVFLQSKANSACYIAQVVNPCYCHFFDRKAMCFFQQDSARPHMVAATQHAFSAIQQLPWPARTQDFSPIVYVWDMMTQDLTLSPEPATAIPELQQWLQDAWDILLQDDIWHSYNHLHAIIYTCVIARGGYTAY